jgi:UDP-N-acetyl-2-amino-2-deoxyglucuronate dehydrogenase
MAEVVALADPSPSVLEATRSAAGLAVEDVFGDPLELIAREDVDAVDICTPQHLRRRILLNAARARKHILCEKPLATIPADAAAAVAAAEEGGVMLAVVHNYLWLPEVEIARQAIASGEIGEVRTAIVNFLGVVDVRGSAAYAADWRHDPAQAGGGVLIDMLHGIYLAEGLLGETLQRVSAFVDGHDGNASVEDIALCRFETETKAALVNIGWGYGAGGIEISGTKGRIAIRYRDGGTAPWAPLEHVLVDTIDGRRIALGPEHRGVDAYGLSYSLRDSFERVVADFARAVRDGESPVASGVDGQRILEATIGAYESGATGRIVGLPLPEDDPAFTRGVMGLRSLELPEWSPVRRRSLYGARAG